MGHKLIGPYTWIGVGRLSLLPSQFAFWLLKNYSVFAPTERGGYRLARMARALRPRDRWSDRFVTPEGIRLQLDLAVYPDVAMAVGLYELSMVRCLKRRLRPGDHFVDAGANLGYFTWLAAKLVGSGGRVDAFEPQPDNHARLRSHWQLNGSPRQVQLHELALSDREGEAVIHLPVAGQEAGNHGASSLFAPHGMMTRDAKVKTVRMDEVLQGTLPKLVKMDIEGAEPWAIDGMAGLLQNEHPPTLIIEFNPTQARQAGVEAGEFIHRLLRIVPRYQAAILERGCRPIHLTPEKLARLHQCNLLFECQQDAR